MMTATKARSSAKVISGVELQDYRVIWAPQPGPQRVASCIPGRRGDHGYDDLGFGGARGGGKSDEEIGDWVKHSSEHGRHARALTVRMDYTQMAGFIRRARELLEPIGAKFFGHPSCCRMPNGAEMLFRGVRDLSAAAKFMGENFTRIYAEELTNWPTSDPLDRLKACLRSAHGVACQFRSTFNPGGPGHGWVKNRYWDPAPGGWKTIIDPRTKERRCFIPSRLEDNPALMKADPDYERRIIAGAGSKELAKAWRWGIWDIVPDGAFDQVWRPDRQILPQFKVPENWDLAFSFDWGYSKPSAGIWGAISDGNPVDTPAGERTFPKGSVILWREYYTCAKDQNGNIQANTGLRLDNQQLGQDLARFEEYDRMTFDSDPSGRYVLRVADSAIFTEMGGPSIYAQLNDGAGKTLDLYPSDKNRISGFQTMIRYLAESASAHPEGPGLWMMEDLHHTNRTLPLLQRDQRIPDDVDTFGEDHIFDAIRYMLQGLVNTPAIHQATILGW